MNLDTIVSWLNNNQGILEVMLFVVTPLGGFLILLLNKLMFRRKKKHSPPDTDKNSPMKGIINAGRDVNAGRDIIGEQHNVTNKAYTHVSTHNKDQPIIEVKMNSFYSFRNRYMLSLSLRNIGYSPGIVYDLLLNDERLAINNITLHPNDNWVSLSFDISNFKILREKDDSALLEVFYKNIDDEPGKTITKVIQESRADNGFNINRIIVEQYKTPDKLQSQEGSMILLEPSRSDIWDKIF